MVAARRNKCANIASYVRTPLHIFLFSILHYTNRSTITRASPGTPHQRTSAAAISTSWRVGINRDSEINQQSGRLPTVDLFLFECYWSMSTNIRCRRTKWRILYAQCTVQFRKRYFFLRMTMDRDITDECQEYRWYHEHDSCR